MAASVDVKKLKEMAKANPTYKYLFEHLASRVRATRETHLPALKSNLLSERPFKNFNHDDFAKFWEDLNRIGAGKLITSAMGRPRKFDWAGINPITVGKCALGKAQSVEHSKFRVLKSKRSQMAAMSTAQELPREPVMHGSDQYSAAGLYMVFMTESHETIHLRLQNGLTHNDKLNLIKFIQDVPVRSN